MECKRISRFWPQFWKPTQINYKKKIHISPQLFLSIFYIYWQQRATHCNLVDIFLSEKKSISFIHLTKTEKKKKRSRESQNYNNAILASVNTLRKKTIRSFLLTILQNDKQKQCIYFAQIRLILANWWQNAIFDDFRRKNKMKQISMNLNESMMEYRENKNQQNQLRMFTFFSGIWKAETYLVEKRLLVIQSAIDSVSLKYLPTNRDSWFVNRSTSMFLKCERVLSGANWWYDKKQKQLHNNSNVLYFLK